MTIQENDRGEVGRDDDRTCGSEVPMTLAEIRDDVERIGERWRSVIAVERQRDVPRLTSISSIR